MSEQRLTPSLHASDRTDKRVRVATGVYQRSGGFEIQFVDSTGRSRFKKTTARNVTEAKAEREKMRVDVRAGTAVVPSKVKVAEVAADFLSMFEGLVLAGEKSDRTLQLYRQRWRTHLEEPLGRLAIQAVRPEHVARILDGLRRDGKKPWTIKGVYIVLGSIFGHALTRGLIAESPLRKLSRAERPTGRSATKARVLTDEECGKLIAKTPITWRAMVAVAASTGLRLSELLGLRWQDVNTAGGLIHVRHQLSVGTSKNPAKLTSLKTGAGERDVYVLSELGEMLKREKARAFRAGHAKPEDYVFATRDGHPLSQRNAGRALRTAGDNAGLNPEAAEPVSWHDLRHSAISRLIAAGLDVVEVQRQAGHSKPSITLDFYAHDFEKAKRSDDIRAKIAATGMGAALTGA